MKRLCLARRTFLASALLALPVGASAQTQGQMTRKMLEDGIDALRRTATRHHLTGSWDEPGVPIRTELLPPAGEERVAAAEARMGRSMPPGLRRFFRDTTAGIDIQWLLPGQRRTTASGSSTVEYTAVPPSPFGTQGPPLDALVNAGSMRVMLDDGEELRGEWEWWREARKQGEQEEADPAIKAHEHYHAAVWQRGFPIARTMGGDIIAVDTSDPKERLIVLRHDGDDAPALLLGHDLPTHLAHQARLSFVGFETFRMELFADEKQGVAAVADFAPTVADLITEHDLFLPRACVIDAGSQNALAWRRWTEA